MIRYSEFRPTQFDHNIELDGRADWFVCQCSHNRDSDDLSESNWHSQFDELVKASGGELDTDDWEIHRFGHWASGWFEIAIVRPDSPAFRVACDLERALEDYPVLDDGDLSSREHESALTSWNNWGCDEFRKELVSAFGLGEITAERLDDISADSLWELHHEFSPYGYETGSDGPDFDFRYIESSERFTRDELAKFIRKELATTPV